MISPHTPPGTKVVCIDAQGVGIFFGFPSPLVLDAVYTLASIEIDAREPTKPYAFLHEFERSFGFALRRFRPLDLPGSITSCLTSQDLLVEETV